MEKSKVVWTSILKTLAYTISLFTLFTVYVYNRSLFLDSLNLARNIAESSYHELTLPLKYEQSAPLLFLCLSKVLTTILGISEYSLRLLPLLSGIASIFLFSKILDKCLKSHYVVLGIFWLGTHAMLIRYATEFKQYSTDVFISIFLIWITLQVDKVNIKQLSALGIIGALSIWISMPAIFVMLGMIGYLLLNNLKDIKSIYAILILAAWLSLNFIFEYYTILQPAIHSHHMQNFHQNYFLQGRFWEIESLQHDFGLIISSLRLVVGKSGLAIGMAWILICASIYSLIKQNQNIGILFILPLLGVFGASLLGKYSLIERLILFSIPLILFLILHGLQEVIGYLKFKSNWIRYSLITTIATALIVGFIQIQGIKYLFIPLEIEDNRTSLQFIDQDKNHSNTILCSQFAFPAYSYYTKYDVNYMKLNLGKAVTTKYGDNISAMALNLSKEEKKDIWVLLGHLPEAEISRLFIELDKIGTIKNSYRTKRSAAILFSTQ